MSNPQREWIIAFKDKLHFGAKGTHTLYVEKAQTG